MPAVRRSGRALKSLVAQPVEPAARILDVNRGSWGIHTDIDAAVTIVDLAFKLAMRIRDDRDTGEAALVCLNAAVKRSVINDRAAYTVKTSKRLANKVEHGLCPAVHRDPTVEEEGTGCSTTFAR